MLFRSRDGKKRQICDVKKKIEDTQKLKRLPGAFFMGKNMDLDRKLQIVYRKVEDLIPYERNSRTHSEEQIEKVVASIKEFGWTNPILIDEEQGIIAGHGRLEAAKRLGMKEVPVLVLTGLTEAQKRAYIIADNKLALEAGWDEDLLKEELEWLTAHDYSSELTGYA